METIVHLLGRLDVDRTKLLVLQLLVLLLPLKGVNSSILRRFCAEMIAFRWARLILFFRLLLLLSIDLD